MSVLASPDDSSGCHQVPY